MKIIKQNKLLFKVMSGADKQSLLTEIKNKIMYSSQSVKSFISDQDIIHSIKYFYLYTIAEYTRSISAEFVQPCKWATVVPVTSLHSNFCKVHSH